MSVSETVSSLKTGGETRLRRNALSLGQIVASTLASIAPAMSFFFGFAVIVQGAGIAAPLQCERGTSRHQQQPSHQQRQPARVRML